MKVGYLSESMVVCHQYRVNAQRVRGNQQIKWCKYLALARHVGSNISITLCCSAVPWQHIDAP